MRPCERSTTLTHDEQYEMRREVLIPVAIHNLMTKLKTSNIRSSALLDEIDRLYDEMYRPNQAQARAAVKEHIRSMYGRRLPRMIVLDDVRLH